MDDRKRQSAASSPDQAAATSATPAPTAPSSAARGSREINPGQHQGHSAEPTTAEGQRLTDLDGIRFDCVRGALYHEDRERHYALMHRAIMFVTIATSMAAIADPLRDLFPWTAVAFQFSAGLAAVVDLVWDVSGKARLHANLKRGAFELLADADENDADCAKLRIRITRSLADEPPTMHAVNAWAFNKAARTLGRPDDCRVEITPRQVAFRHWWSFSEATFPDPP